MKLIQCIQGSAEWLEARLGVTTASKFRDACDTTAKGVPTSKSNTYAAQVALEWVTGQPADEQFVTWQMKRGIELEPAARLAYEQETGNVVEEAGVAVTDDGRYGYSTDGFIGTDGAVEFKCLSSPEKLITMWRDRDLSEYMDQIQGGLWITGRQWVDFVMYAPQLEPVGKALFIERVRRDEKYIKALAAGLELFAARVAANVAVLRAPIETPSPQLEHA
jgi:exodeoxyribonuclease (lambda-induced)